MKKPNPTIEAKIQLEKHDRYLMLHEEMVKGSYRDDKFRFIRDVSNRGFAMEFKGKSYVLSTKNLVSAIMDSILDQK